MKKKMGTNISKDGILNAKEEKTNDQKETLKKYMAINQKNSTFLGYFVVSLATIIIIIYIPLFIKKLKYLSQNKIFLINFLNYHMHTLILDEIILRVLWMQILSNNLQSETIDKGFNNSFNLYSSYIELQIYDYNAFYIQFNQFFTSKLSNRDLTFFQDIQKPINYKIPDRNGKKIEISIPMKNIHIPIILHPIQEVGKIQIYYNISDYYFNETMINNSGYSYDDFYYASYGYIGFLINFQTEYKFNNIETFNQFILKIILEETNNEKIISNILFINISIFAAYNFFCWYIFYSQSTQLFARYFVSHTQLRFFNNYLLKKTILIYEYIDNNSYGYKIQKAISEIEFENEFEQVLTIRNICSGQIDNYKFIKIRPLTVKYNSSQTNILDINNNESKVKGEESSKELLSIIKKKKTNQKFQKQLSIPAVQNPTNSINKNAKIKNEKMKHSSIFLNVKNLEENTKRSNKELIKIKEKSNKKLVNTSRSNISHSTFQSSINLLNNTPNSKGILLNNNINVNNNNNNKNNQSEQIGHRLLSKPLLYIGLFIFLIFLSITLIIIGFIHFEVSFDTRKTFRKVSSVINCIFLEQKFLKELLMNFQTSILLNEVFTFEFQGNEFISSCKELNSIYDNEIHVHEIFLETSICFPNIKKGVDDLTQGKAPSVLKRIINFQNQIDSKNFCETLSETSLSIKNNKLVKELKIAQNISKEEILDDCVRIGGDLNKEGLSTVITGIYTTLNSLYNDFKENKNRNEEYNYQLINEPNLLMFQIEYNQIFTRISICYYVLAHQDIMSFYKSVVKNESIFFFVEIVLMFLGIIVYFYFVVLYGREINTVDFFNKCTLHMILFK